MNQNQTQGEVKKPDWYDGRSIHEPGLLNYIRSAHFIRCVNGRFYDEHEQPMEDPFLRQWIVDVLSQAGITVGLTRKSRDILELMRIQWYYDPPKPRELEVCVKNGILNVSTLELDTRPCFCLNRLPVEYDPNAPEPRQFLGFLDQLLEKEDQKTLQEYLGYCLLPTNRAQKMLLLVGKGGEGKSTLGRVVSRLFGRKAMSGSIQKVSTNQFARADLEGKLVLIDDDMSMEALTQTHYFKTLVTLEGETDLEKKGVQSYQGRIYARFLAFSNGNLSALYDHSLAFYRRQIVLRVKERQTDRTDDPYLAEDMFDELPGIFNWCIRGLHRLVEQGFSFTISASAKAYMEEQMRENNTVLSFLESDGYLVFEPDRSVTSADLYDCYRHYCEENSLPPASNSSFQKRFKELAGKYRLRATTHVPGRHGKSIRGYVGIRLAAPNGW